MLKTKNKMIEIKPDISMSFQVLRWQRWSDGIKKQDPAMLSVSDTIWVERHS